ncbi:fumarate reductase/succinate dehydrogenase flavoprotein-like protein [Fonsecaea pedrosoi]|nr:fumarate reductase/succinate dehydrogenase flavoprotein-like protein [Fonsecaea pedrosoi]
MTSQSSSADVDGRWDEEYDIICVGSGIGGLSGAITAASKGLKTLVVEKTPQFGGVTALSGGQIWSPANKYQLARGIEDSLEDGIRYIESLADGWANDRMTRNLFHAANEAFDFLEEKGVRFRMIPNLPDYYYPDLQPFAKRDGRYIDAEPFDLRRLGDDYRHKLRHKAWSSPEMAGITGRPEAQRQDFVYTGEALAGYLLQAALEAGATCRTNSPATRLIRGEPEAGTSPRVTGVVVKGLDGGGREQRIRARLGVLLAVGGYDYNSALVHRYEGRFEPHGTLVFPGIDGDHLAMGADAGAAIATLPPSRSIVQRAVRTGIRRDEDLSSPTLDNEILAMYWPVGPHEIVVNRAGKRFADETFYPELHASLHVLDPVRHVHPHWPTWLVMDDNYWSSPMRRQQPGPPKEQCHVADTLDELATKAGIDPRGLKSTVDRYNDMCRQGRDDDFHRGERPWVTSSLAFAPLGTSPLGPIEQAPFYATKLIQAFLGVGAAGLEINQHAQVVRQDGRPVPGLYAAGNSAARTDLGMMLQSGVTNLRGMVYGFLAAKHMADNGCRSRSRL